MPINTVPKTNPNNPNSQPPARPSVQVAPRSVSTARAEELKKRLTNPQAPASPQAAAPRPAGSTARAEQFAKLQKYPTPTAPAPAAPGAAPQQPHTQPLQDVEPPPPQPGQPSAAQAQQAVTDAAKEVRSAQAAVDSTKAAIPTSGEAGTNASGSEASDPLTSTQFALLARQESRLRKAQQEFKAAQEAWKQEQAAQKDKFISKESFTSDPLKALAELGITYDRLTELQLDQVSPDPQKPLLDRITQLEKQLADQQAKVDDTFKQRDDLQVQQALQQFRKDAELLVSSDPAYETIAATGSVGEVVDLIKAVFDAEGELLSVEEAAKLVEDKLRVRELERFEKLSKLSHIKSKLAPQPTEAPPQGEASAEAITPPQQPEQPQPAPQPTSRTLTNTGAVTRPMTARERAIQKVEELNRRRGQGA